MSLTVGQYTLCTASTGHWFILPLTKGRVSKLPAHHSCISAVPVSVTDCSPQAFNTDFHPAFSNTTSQLNSTISAFIASCWNKIELIKKLDHTLHKSEDKQYLCTSLQHHCYDHSLSYTDLLHDWSNLTVLILLLYIPHCPRVWVQFHDQSRH